MTKGLFVGIMGIFTGIGFLLMIAGQIWPSVLVQNIGLWLGSGSFLVIYAVALGTWLKQQSE